MQLPERYNIRVYGIYINEYQQVLVTDEYRANMYMTKFPGGGHEFGEGLTDSLIREWEEELSVEIKVGNFFYINDFALSSAFSSKEQLLSVYYRVTPLEDLSSRVSMNSFDFKEGQEPQSFRWISLEEIGPDDFTFPVDKKVAEILAESRGN